MEPIVIDRQIALAQIGRALPDFAARRLRLLGEGDFCRAYLVNEALVFRFAKHEAARASLRRERCLLPQLAARLALPIPRPAFAALDEPAAFLAHPLLPGVALSRRRYLALDEDARMRAAASVGAFLEELHAFDPSPAAVCGVETKDYRAEFTAAVAGARRHLFPALERHERRFVERAAESYLAVSTPGAFRLLHGDLSPGHVMFDAARGEVCGVIDFGDLAIGDPAQDFLWIYEDYGLDFLARLWPHYQTDAKSELLDRIFLFSQLAAVEWAVETLLEKSPDAERARRHLKKICRDEENSGRGCSRLKEVHDEQGFIIINGAS